MEVVDSISSSIGTYNIPTALVEPFSEGGLRYTTETDIDYPYPTFENLVQYQETTEGLLFTIFPIQHNPATDETTFYNNFKIQVTYESPLTVAVSDFSTDKGTYVIGEVISTQTRIENIGDQDVTLTANLIIQDALGEVAGTLTSGEFVVESGSLYFLPLAWSGILDNLDYSVQIMLYSEASFVGGSSTWISVSSGEITELSTPTQLLLGEQGNFEVKFVNYDDDPVSGQITLTIIDGEGRHIEEVKQQNITLTGGSIETTTFTWTPIDVNPGRYDAYATAIFDSRTVTVQSFCVLFDVEELYSKLDEANDKISTLEEELQAKEDEIADLEEELQAKEDEIATLEEELADSQETIEELENLVSELRTTVEGLRKWQTYTYVAAAIAGLLLIILLLTFFRK